MDSPQSPTLIDVDAVIGSERIKDPRGDSTERRIAVVERMTDADGGYAMARFERGSSGIWGLGIDTVGARYREEVPSAYIFAPGRPLQQIRSYLPSECRRLRTTLPSGSP